MVLADKSALRAEETDEEVLFFDISDDVLERASGINGLQAITWMYGTMVVGGCGCPV